MWLAGLIFTAVTGLIGWVIKMIFGAIKELRDGERVLRSSIDAHKLHAAETYATKTDVKDGFDRVMNKLDSIDDKLDRKVDKA